LPTLLARSAFTRVTSASSRKSASRPKTLSIELLTGLPASEVLSRVRLTLQQFREIANGGVA
jgi:hypothetical protein